MNKSVLLLLDGNSLINRAFYGLFGRQQLTAPDGTPTGALFAFMNMFLRYLEQVKPSHVVVAFDRKEKTVRHDLFADYKGTRKPMPDELALQLPILKDLLDGMGIPRLEMAGYEADDLLGTLAEMGKQQDAQVFIVTGDKDSFQLVDDRVTIIWPVTRKGQSDLEIYDRQAIIDRYQLQPEQFVDFKAIMGDPSDNIPGVKGIGEKGAMQLLQAYPSLDALYDALDDLKPAQATKLRESREMAYLSKQLSKIIRDVPVNVAWQDLKKQAIQEEKLATLLTSLGLKQLMTRLDIKTQENELYSSKLAADNMTMGGLQSLTDWISKCVNNKNTCHVTSREDDIDNQKEDTDDSKVNAHDGQNIPAVWITAQGQMLLTSDGKDTLMLPKTLMHDAWQQLSQNQIRLAVCDYKQLLHDWDLPALKCPAHDVLLAAHLLNQTDGRPDLERIYQVVTGQALLLEKSEETGADYQEQDLLAMVDAGQQSNKKQAISHDADDILNNADHVLNDEINREKDPADQEPADALSEADLTALGAVFTIAENQVKAITERDINRLTYEIEMPLAAVLADVEKRGFAVDKDKLAKLGDVMDKRLAELQTQIHALAGSAFNLNSPKQLSEVLYQDLGLKPGKKRSGGAFSTDSSELERLLGEHPIIELIIEHRQTAKLRSTYVEGLKKVIHPEDGRVHTTFNQMLTTTGRLSSSEPNLQNIPIRMEAGQKIRETFIAAPGFILLDADYSQIELRLLAHMADDPNMIDAFVHEADIHTQTACSIFGCTADEVNTEQRAIAKTMNFSIVYGISDFGLARDLGVTVKTAHRYIQEYDAQYPMVRAWLEKQVEKAHEQGYVETLFGRRRYLHELKSTNRNVRQFGERAAMNAPVQGTAADLIKIAMVRTDQALKAAKLEARLILQVHDELIVEAPEAEAEAASLILREAMESAMKLKVPLKADVMRGYNWAACK